MKKIISVFLIILSLFLILPVYAQEDQALDITIIDNECSALNEGSSYDPEHRVLTLAEGEYGNITCNNDLTIKTKGTVAIFEIKVEKTHGSSTLKIVNSKIKTNPNHVGSRIICNGDIELTNSTIVVDYFIVTETGIISISNSDVTVVGIDKMMGYIFAGGNIYIRNSKVTADYNINTYGSMVVEKSSVKLLSKYSHGGYITSPKGFLVKDSDLDIFYYIYCDMGDFRAVNSNIHISLNMEDNKRRSNIEVVIGNIIIANCVLDVDAFLKCRAGNISISNSNINTGSLVSWNGSITLDRVEGSINGAKSIDSESATGIFGKKIELLHTKLPDSHVIGNAVIGEDKYATISFTDGEMAYGFKLFAEPVFPVYWIVVIAAAVVLAVIVLILLLRNRKKKQNNI